MNPCRVCQTTTHVHREGCWLGKILDSNKSTRGIHVIARARKEERERVGEKPQSRDTTRIEKAEQC